MNLFKTTKTERAKEEEKMVTEHGHFTLPESSKSKTPTLILARYLRDAQRYATDHNLGNRWHFVSDVNQLRGIRGWPLIKVDGWDANKDQDFIWKVHVYEQLEKTESEDVLSITRNINTPTV